ncbi:flagellar motor switch protein FliN [Thermovirga lienii DSM 17291]|uniref:Flagellar motor switch protein FliN n=1 Tax=Thermovirga lienii (strain ATCC BAA-1197 / DSM 17291 / Cas60314) TaxID=580340 RepID=G7V5T3_THELD|nr:flagellar motor switch protein FliN [Thermovirga lienii]AER65838.1 flagellar motor switch protein FliN [Thermovirga lienii DSM 17291]
MDEEKRQNEQQPNPEEQVEAPKEEKQGSSEGGSEAKEQEISPDLSMEELEAISKGLEGLEDEGTATDIPDLESMGQDAQLSIDELIASVKASSNFDFTPGGQVPTKEQPKAQPASFPDISQGAQGFVPSAAVDEKIDLLMDIPVKITVVLGRTKKTIGDILAIEPGAVIELDRQVGEPVEITVNDRPIFKGEVVVIEENFGVRITEIVEKQGKK